MTEKGRKTALSTPEAKAILDLLDLEKADQIQKRAVDYVAKFCKTNAEKAKKMREKLVKDCGLSEEESVEICNVMPESVEELRVFTAGWKKLVPVETLQKILAIIDAHK